MSARKLSSMVVGLLLSSLATAWPVCDAVIARRDPTTDVLRGADFPDPSIIVVDQTSYAFSTSSETYNIGIASNSNFMNPFGWSNISDAFPTDNVPAFSDGGWAVPGTSWAPDVNHLTDWDGSFVMYYSPQLRSNSALHCVGVARSLNVEGPYNDSSTAPWVCPEEDGGAIDAAGFLDGNTRYVMYKIDGPAVNGGGYCASKDNIVTNTSIMLQQTEADGYTKVGGPVQIWNNQGEVDGYQTEAPQIVKGGDGTYFLFFSTGCFLDESYTTSYVTSTNGIYGPYGNPRVLLKTGDYDNFGPGGADITPENGLFVYHSLINDDITQGRYMNTGTLTLNGQTAWID